MREREFMVRKPTWCAGGACERGGGTVTAMGTWWHDWRRCWVVVGRNWA